MMEPQSQVQATSTGLKSGFGHHMLEAQRVVELKTAFQNKLLVGQFEDVRFRDEMYDLAYNLAAEIRPLASIDERAAFSMKLQNLRRSSVNISSLQMALQHDTSLIGGESALYGLVRNFKDICLDFSDFFIGVQDRANLKFNKLKDQGEIWKYLNFMEVDMKFMNPAGIYISPQMELFCRGLSQRSKKGQCNIVIVGAKMGKGKSTFTLAGATTVAAMNGTTFNVDTDVIQSESREESMKRITSLQQGGNLIFDQAGNQVSAASRWEEDQIDLINTADRSRFHSPTLWFNWHATKALDKDVRQNISTIEVAIDRIGGPAMIKGFNLNPLSNGPVIDVKTRTKVAITPEQAAAISEADTLKLLEVPFYPLDFGSTATPNALDLWKRYSDKKEKANRFAVKITRRTSGTVDIFYDDFLASQVPNVVRITSQALDAYSSEKGMYLSMRELAKRIANATHGKAAQIFKSTNLMNLNEGYIDVDGIISTYIDRLRAQKAGALQFAKERAAHNHGQ